MSTYVFYHIEQVGSSFFTIKLLRSPLIRGMLCSKIHDLFFDVYLKETGDYEILEEVQLFYAFRVHSSRECFVRKYMTCSLMFTSKKQVIMKY
jgi:hypothetical protein